MPPRPYPLTLVAAIVCSAGLSGSGGGSEPPVPQLGRSNQETEFAGPQDRACKWLVLPRGVAATFGPTRTLAFAARNRSSDVGTAVERSDERSNASDLTTLERAISSDPENLRIAADYRQRAIAASNFDRPIEFLDRLAKRKGSGPNVQISLALAYVDKVPTSGDIRRLYLGRDAMNALTRAIEQRRSVLAYYMRGLINLYYNRFIFHRTDKGVADLIQAVSMVTAETSAILVERVYIALGDGYFRLGKIAKARETWSTGISRFPGSIALRERLAKDGEPLADVVTTALTASRRVDTSLAGVSPLP